MNYKIIMYCGIIGTIITLISTILIFIKDNVLNLLKDLIGSRKISSKSKKNKEYIQTEIMDSKHNYRDKDIKSEIVQKTIAYDSETELINEETSILLEEEETSLLNYKEEETTLLNEEETSLLGYEEEETALLGDEEETSILVEDILGENDYIIEKDVMVINCKLVI